jgi:hypothetical protein
MQSSVPSSGLGVLKPKEISTAAPPTDKVNPSLVPQGEFYRELAKKMATFSVAVTILVTPSSSVDLATISTQFLSFE